MCILGLFGLHLCMALQAVSGGSAPQDVAPDYRISVPRVELTVSVTDRKTHQPVPDLKQSNFRILDDGKPVTVTHFDPPDHPRPLMVWLLLRNDYIDQGTLKKIEAEMPQALKSLPDSARIGVASYSEMDSVLWLSPQPSRDAALAAIHRLALANPDLEMGKRPRKSKPVQPLPAGSAQGQDTSSAAPVEREKVKHPMVRAMAEIGPSGGLRIVEKDWASHRDSGFTPVVVLLSDEMSIDFVWSAEKAKNALLREGLTMYELEEPHGGFSRAMVTMLRVYAPAGIPLSPGAQMYRYRYETILAKASGGEVIAVKSHNYREGFERVFRDLNSAYSLEFAPSTIDGKWHRISAAIQSSPGEHLPNCRVRVREKYFAGQASPETPGNKQGALTSHPEE